ncbi:MAG TPA: MOSC domain-containing protein [Ktedonobacterales bacterium]
MTETMRGRIVQINISRGGVPKLPVTEARVRELGLVGDLHDDIASHGGPMRALCLYTMEEIERLQAEGHPIYPGAAGENVTLRGVALAELVPGTRLALGDEVVIEITGYTTPCKTIREAFNDGDFSRISHKTHPGESRVYARVLREGVMRPGDAVQTLVRAE